MNLSKQKISGGFLSLLFGLLLLRFLSDIAESFKRVGWTSFSVEGLTKINSAFMMVCLLIVLIVLSNTLTLSNKLAKGLFIMIIVLIGGVVNGCITFSGFGMPISGVFNIMFRYGIEILLIIYTFNFSQIPDAVSRINKFVQLLSWIIVVLSFLQLATHSYYTIQGVDRIVGPFTNPNVLGIFSSFCISARIIAGANSKMDKLLIACLYIVLLFSGSMTSLLCNLVFLFFYMKEKSKNFFAVVVKVGTALIAVASVCVLVAMDFIINRLSILFNFDNGVELSEGSSILWRFMAWSSYIGMLKTPGDYLFGMGTGFHRCIFLLDYPHAMTSIFEAPGTHNDYIALLVDYGIIGLVLFLIFIIGFLRMLFKTGDKNLRLWAYFICTMLFAMTMDNYLDQYLNFVIIGNVTVYYQAYIMNNNNYTQGA